MGSLKAQIVAPLALLTLTLIWLIGALTTELHAQVPAPTVHTGTASPALTKQQHLSSPAAAAPLALAGNGKPRADSSRSIQIGTTLPAIVRETLARHFNRPGKQLSFEQFNARFAVKPEDQQRLGIFVTLSKRGKTRACWGSIYPLAPDLVHATILATEKALSRDYRYPPIQKSELNDLKAQVTIIKDIVPLSSINEQNPLVFGLMVRNGSRGAVILPGEAVDAYYQMVLCKLKAGIPAQQKCQLYRIIADVRK